MSLNILILYEESKVRNCQTWDLVIRGVEIDPTSYSSPVLFIAWYFS